MRDSVVQRTALPATDIHGMVMPNTDTLRKHSVLLVDDQPRVRKQLHELLASHDDLEIVGDRPGEFHLFQREYKKQLVAGYSKNTPSNGLVAHMADYSRFQSTPR